MSFLLDPPLLVAAGGLAEATLGDEARRARVARNATVGAFVGVSLALYANYEPLARRWPTFGARSGREFMLASGLASVDEDSISRVQHLVALSLFALYPAWYELGRRLMRRRAAA